MNKMKRTINDMVEDYKCFICDGTPQCDTYTNVPDKPKCVYNIVADNDLQKYHQAKQGTEFDTIVKEQFITLAVQLKAYLKSRE